MSETEIKINGHWCALTRDKLNRCVDDITSVPLTLPEKQSSSAAIDEFTRRTQELVALLQDYRTLVNRDAHQLQKMWEAWSDLDAKQSRSLEDRLRDPALRKQEHLSLSDDLRSY